MDVIRINAGDQVAVAPQGLRRGQVVRAGAGAGEIVVLDEVPPCHKVAVEAIAAGAEVRKYGCPFGVATADIEPGRWVHTHNVKTQLAGILNYSYQPALAAAVEARPETASFLGYRRRDGQVGIRNYVFVIPTVLCANGVAKAVTDRLNEELPASGSFDGFIALPHVFGCSQTGEDLLNTQRILAGLAHNPNAGGVLFLSLGCEVNAPSVFRPVLGEVDEAAVRFLVMQEVEDEIGEAVRIGRQLYEYATGFRRAEAPLARLVIGVNCGGSDGLSGLTANPLVGDMTDRFVGLGGSVVMTEVPEMLGAEQFLMNRARDEETYRAAVRMVNDYKNYFASHGERADGNLTQGNQAGGLSTLEEKSLGCIQKAGRAVVADVLASGERLRRPGLTLLSGPGNDFIGITAQIAAGCNLIVFTTGRGTPGGFAAPTLRISSNSSIYNKKRHWIDFDAGVLLAGADRQETAARLCELVLKTANGEYRTRNEINKYFEIGILKDGITL